MTVPTLDEDAVVACADLVARTGARNFEIGYVHDDVPVEEAGWYAHAQLKGTRITEEDHRGPTEAADALARRLLTGAQCRCGRLVALSDHGAVSLGDATMADGTKWTAEEAEAAGQCRWRRVGSRWERGCTTAGIHPRLAEQLRRDGIDPEAVVASMEKATDEETLRLAEQARARATGRLVAAGWERHQSAKDGLGLWDHRRRGLRLIHSVARVRDDGEVWAHVSVSRRDRKLPTWEQTRDVFWLIYDDLPGVIVVAPPSEHVNLREVMHVWACLTKRAVPDFSEGMGTI